MSQLTDAIISGMAQQFDPNARMISAYMAESTEQLRVQNRDAKAEQIARISKLMAEAKSNSDTPASVLDAYDRLLTQLTS